MQYNILFVLQQLQQVGNMQERPEESEEVGYFILHVFLKQTMIIYIETSSALQEDSIEFQSITASWWVPLTTSEQHTV